MPYYNNIYSDLAD